MAPEMLAALNALMNGSSALCLILGWRAISRQQKERHRNFMIAAFSFSTLFLIGYLTRFAISGVHRYPGVGWDKTLYLSILGTHTVLAAIVPFLVFRAFYLAWKQRWIQHRKLGKFTLPIWLYVSVTGVVIYLMLYQLN